MCKTKRFNHENRTENSLKKEVLNQEKIKFAKNQETYKKRDVNLKSSNKPKNFTRMISNQKILISIWYLNQENRTKRLVRRKWVKKN